MKTSRPAHNVALACVALAAALSFGSSQAATVSVTGAFNANGYDVISLTVASAGVVDFTYTSGWLDPTFSLFDGSGNHLVTNDDSHLGLYSHLTQNLGVGNYSLLVSYCCNSANYAITSGALFASTDGFNLSGSYWFGGTGTLAGMQLFLDSVGPVAGLGSFALDVSNANVGVPEPAPLALLGLAMAGLALQRRKA